MTGSSCDERLHGFESRGGGGSDSRRERRTSLASELGGSPDDTSGQPKVAFNVKQSLSRQVMDYYRKYSNNSNLEQYFSLPSETKAGDNDGMKCYYSIYEFEPRASSAARQDCVGQDYTLINYIPRERRRWARPPLIGQSAGCTDGSSIYARQLSEPRSPSPEQRRGATPETIPEDKNESREAIGDARENKSNVSPTSSVASHKPLEWDSGADVGYFNTLPQNKEAEKKLSTIERMALARGCSAALRQDPEGTTESNGSSKVGQGQGGAKVRRKPDANSTPLPGNFSETESEVEITPIVKNHAPGMMTGIDASSEERKRKSESEDGGTAPIASETPKSSGVFKIPQAKYAAETSLLKKSSSMNILAPINNKLLLKRSQSDLNLLAKDRGRANALPLIFDSTSSLATVVNRPATCDKVIQTTIDERFRESVGIQVSVFDEEKPPVPKRGTSLAQKTIPSILKGSKNSGRRRDESGKTAEDCKNVERGTGNCTDASGNGSRSATPRLDDTENVAGRANSFEYFPGHVYENVPNGCESHVSSVDTRRSNSTMPNTSSSIDEKLWGDSDSLVRDLERSVNILKSLVDAKKCDKQVKKRLIHHVVKRLVTAKYTDDKIEHDLEENVPWNPDDARKKVYRADIIQALTKKQNTTDSSEEWKPPKKKKGPAAKKQLDEEVRLVGEMITPESSNSEKFDAPTDRTEMDGRKARMGLRTNDDCHGSSNSPTDANKSESSECFMPQRKEKAKEQRESIFCYKQNGDSSTSDNPLDRNRIYLNAAVDNRQSTIESSDASRNPTDWRLPTTLSERQFELRRRNTSESGDSKLVSYAETEKKNQLLWITNEISHLSNLKKLLEEPKKFERQRMSPKKIKHAIVKQKPSGVLKCLCGIKRADISDDIPRSASEVCDESTGPQWSSHCNLATCQSTVESSGKNFENLKKRNSCTQTGTKSARAHSQTGGEVASAVTIRHNLQPTLVNVHVQTSTYSPSSSPPPLRSRLAVQSADISPKIFCPVHNNSLKLCQCASRQQTGQGSTNNPVSPSPSPSPCLCPHSLDQRSTNKEAGNVCRCSSTSPLHTNHKRVIPNRNNGPINEIHQPFSHGSEKEMRKSESKDAKNKVNATKSTAICRCECGGVALPPKVCQCVGSCSCETDRVKRGNGNCQFCYNNIEKLCDCRDYCNCEKKRNEAVLKFGMNGCNVCKKKSTPVGEKYCKCVGECECDNKKVDRDKNSDKKSCECFKERAECKCVNFCFCCSKYQSRAYHLSKNFHDTQHQQQSVRSSKNEVVVCKCGKECCCENKLRDIERRLYSPKRSARTNCSCEVSRATESNGTNVQQQQQQQQQHCRSCGSVYQNGRKCSCNINNYPKPIAYELSFDDDDDKPKKINNGFLKQNVKIDGKKSNDPDDSFSPTNTAVSNGGCLCEDTKFYTSSKSSGRTKTLQDYLAENKPDFLNNVETRQQCMFEISQLRELRREKRVQLLALASGSNLTKTPRLSKPKVLSAQRKISDEEMKERLRKRYYKLHEVRNKRQQREKQEQARRNKLMANIFCKKLQQKVLKGQVDLSNSVSVISNL